MTPAMRKYLEGLSFADREVLKDASVQGFRTAWPRRHGSQRAAVIARCNAKMLRNIRTVEGI